MQIDLTQIDDYIVWIGGIALALTAIAFLFRGIYRVVYKTGQIHYWIKKEMTTNGGSSVKDIVADISKDVKALRTRTSHIESRLRVIEKKVNNDEGMGSKTQ